MPSVANDILDMKPRRSVFQKLQQVVASAPSRCAPCNALRQACRATQVRRTYATVSVSAADLQFGQPVHETHPHLLRPGESVFHFKKFRSLSVLTMLQLRLASQHRNMRTVERNSQQVYLLTESPSSHPQIRSTGLGL